MSGTQQRYAVILHPYWKNMAGCQLFLNAIATAKTQFPTMERRMLVRHIHLHCKYELRLVFCCSEADGVVTTYPEATDQQVETFIATALQEDFDTALGRMDDTYQGFIDAFGPHRTQP